ncbi:MAG TPA: tetratricopeptide repeat protein [Terriglobia bacterium]|nr:tetratricopeptide repeat protein [Terriglobia bacterium]
MTPIPQAFKTHTIEEWYGMGTMTAHLKRSARSRTSLVGSVVGLSIMLLLSARGVLAQTTSPTLDDYFRQARDSEKKGDYSAAEKTYLAAAKEFPNQPEILKRLGIVYQTELKFPESIETFQRVLQDAPQYPEVNFYLGLSEFGLNQFDKAVDAFNKELAANPKYRRARYYEALAYQSLNRNADALRQFEILLQDQPNDAAVLYQMIRFLKAATIQSINHLGNLDPNSEYMLILKAEGYTEEGRYAEAIEKYNELLKKNPNFPGAHYGLGLTYWKKVDYTAAEPELRQALREDPNHPMANYYLADILVKSQRTAEAVPLLEIAVAGEPDLSMAYFELGKCYAEQGRLDDALKVLLRAEALDPSDKSTHYQLGQLYARLQQPDKSREEMDTFKKLYAEEREKKRREQVTEDSSQAAKTEPKAEN